MTQLLEQLDYETKASDYFGFPRPEMMPFVPAHCRRILDVGCADGAFGEALKKLRTVEVWGIEPTRSAAAKAKRKLDRVIEGFFDPQLDLPTGTFDCILFNDVLEHMVNPELALRYARTLLAPGGAVVASIPNIRSFPTFWKLLFHARWDYQDLGVLDRTHIRFFTQSSIVDMFEREGFTLEQVAGINAFKGVPNVSKSLWRLYRVASALSFNKLADMRFQQFAVVARLATSGPAPK